MKPYAIFNKNFKTKNIKKVFEEDIRNKPSVGIDGITITTFEKKLDFEMDTINRKILNQTYNFSFYKEKLISKGREKLPRVISIPTIRDKIVLKSIFNTLSEIFSAELSNEIIHTTIDNIIQDIKSKKYDSYIKLDMKDFYPSINHDILLKKVKSKTRKKEFISILEKAIKQETVQKSSPNKDKYTNKTGVPQGLSISSILASIYLIKLDEMNQDTGSYKYYRYVDDILILCNKNDVSRIYSSIDKKAKKLYLTIHPLGENSNKSASGDIGDRFYFLGYLYDKNLVSVRDASKNNLYNSIINIFSQYKHSRTKNKKLLYWKLNLKITGCKFEDKKYGWLYFFSQINDEQLLFRLDRFVLSMFNKFDIEYDKSKVKRFVRTYYEIIKNREKTNYIPNFSTLSLMEKRTILEDIFDKKGLQDFEVEYTFSKIIYKNIKEMERDIQRY